MAVTGLILFGFVLVHLVGNLHALHRPRGDQRATAAFLRTLLHGSALWIARAVLLTAVVLHIWSATSLTLDSWAARPKGYKRWQPRGLDLRLPHHALGRRDPGRLHRLPPAALHARHGAPRLPARATSTTTSSPASRSGRSRVFYIVADGAARRSTSTTASGACARRWGSPPTRATSAGPGGAALLFAVVVGVGNCSFPIAVLAGVGPMKLDARIPVGPARAEVGAAQVRAEARQPGQQAQVHGHRGRHGPRRRAAAPRRSPSSATRSSASATRTARAARTRIAAQGGINAAKNYQNDGDSVFRLFYDTVKGGDFRAREANVYRLAEVSA